MTETDISKVLIEGEYATIMGVKYKRVEEPKQPETLYDALKQLDKPMFVDDVLNAVGEWLPKEHDTNSAGWNKCVRMIREKLR